MASKSLGSANTTFKDLKNHSEGSREVWGLVMIWLFLSWLPFLLLVVGLLTRYIIDWRNPDAAESRRKSSRARCFSSVGLLFLFPLAVGVYSGLLKKLRNRSDIFSDYILFIDGTNKDSEHPYGYTTAEIIMIVMMVTLGMCLVWEWVHLKFWEWDWSFWKRRWWVDIRTNLKPWKVSGIRSRLSRRHNRGFEQFDGEGDNDIPLQPRGA